MFLCGEWVLLTAQIASHKDTKTQRRALIGQYVLVADDTKCRLNVRVLRVFRGSLFGLCVLCVLSRLINLDIEPHGGTPRVRGGNRGWTRGRIKR